MRKCLSLAAAVVALAAPAHALPTQERLSGLPRVGQETLMPGGARIQDGRVYYSIVDEKEVHTTCSGDIDSWFWEMFGARVTWTACWTEKRAAPR